MSKWETIGIWVMIVVATVVIAGAIFTLGSIMGIVFIEGSAEFSFLQFGIIGGGIASTFLLVRNANQLKNSADHARP